MHAVESSAATRQPRRGFGLWKALLAASCIAVLAYEGYSAAYYVSNLEDRGDRDFYDGFENGNLSEWRRGEVELCCDSSSAIVDSGARTGARALKLRLSADDPLVAGSKRAEVRLKAVELGQERWYAFSLAVPESWQFTPEIATLAQWHAVDDKQLGEVGRTPPLRLVVRNGNWAIASHWDGRRLSGIPFLRASPGGGQTLWSGPVIRGQWTDWVFRVRWSYQDDGLIEVWKDGVQIARREGPNAYNDWLGPFFKVGIYIPEWKTQDPVLPGSVRELLVDEVRQSAQPILLPGGSVSLSINTK